MSAEGRKLTEDHRKKQLAIGARLKRDIIRVWRTEYDIDEILASEARVVAALKDMLADYKRESAQEGAAYYKAFREVAGPGSINVKPYFDLDGSRVEQSVGYRARIVPLKAIKAGRSADEASKMALQATTGASERLVREGGRETITRMEDEDPFNKGWQRVVGPEPCAFCAMLSARGGVYSRATVAFEAHDHCQCEAEPIFSRERYLSPSQQELKELYDKYAKGKRHPERAYRRALAEQRERALEEGS